MVWMGPTRKMGMPSLKNHTVQTCSRLGITVDVTRDMPHDENSVGDILQISLSLPWGLSFLSGLYNDQFDEF